MDFNHCDMFNHLLTRKCSCGGDPEMLIDFVADFRYLSFYHFLCVFIAINISSSAGQKS